MREVSVMGAFFVSKETPYERLPSKKHLWRERSVFPVDVPSVALFHEVETDFPDVKPYPPSLSCTTARTDSEGGVCRVWHLSRIC